ncbi:MAG: hypothetical protein E7480_00600 [Ruminococcaceae bacterium]|nr:hypothetical protein [Oscillospiraceae bacterium]
MTEKEVIEFLKGYKSIRFCIEAKTLELERIKMQKSNLCSNKDLSRDKAPYDSSFNLIWQLNSQFDRDMARLIADIERLKAQKNLIDNFINTLLPHEQRLIRLRYFEGKKWSVIETMLNYSQRQPFNIHNKIIKKLAMQLSA